MTVHLFKRSEENMQKLWRSVLLLTTVTAISCVTINIYFPAEQLRGAADRIVDEVWGERATDSEPGQPSAPPVKPPAQPGTYFRILGPTTVIAAQDINVSTPEIRAIRESMKERSVQIVPYLDAGQVGIGRDGLVKIRAIDGLGLKQRGELQRLIDAENQDRQRLYLEIARANGFPDKAAEVQAIFADSWRDKAAMGWYIEQDSGSWKQK
jgi:uncharacterized protein YdbL (DUF1318 family)